MRKDPPTKVNWKEEREQLTKQLETTRKICSEFAIENTQLKQRIRVYEVDEDGLRKTIGHLNHALNALNGVTP